VASASPSGCATASPGGCSPSSPSPSPAAAASSALSEGGNSDAERLFNGRLIAALKALSDASGLPSDSRQSQYVQHGWNITGDAFSMDTDGYFYYAARTDDMIISAGYNIGGPEVESALLTHEAVAECGVVGVPDEERGQIVKAFVVLKPGYLGDAAMARALQDYVKQSIAPYKYPRAIAFRDSLPRTETGKLQRFRLRQD
jgi:acyl-coenzyme A synthetase/AMP-(fatty) acid ligase